jgi:Fe-S cluster assembly protein SufD
MGAALLESLLGDGAALAPAARGEAVAALRRDGLPGARDEAWKYTSLRALEQRRYADGDAAAATRAVDAGAFALPGLDGARLVFVNGAFRADLSDRRALAGLEVVVLAERPDALAALLADDEPGTRSDTFARLNTALVTDGALLRVAAGTRVAEPVHVVFVGASAEADLAWQARLRVELGAGAALTLIEHHVGAGAHSHLGNLVVDGTLAAHARLGLVQIQDAPEGAPLIRRSTFHVGEAATLSAHTLELGAQTMRHDLRVELAGRAARLRSRGVFALHGRQHADTHLDVRHRARDTACDIAWRGVADQRSRGVFHGAITIEAGADGADAQLSNKNLLLSAQAEIDTQPVLEIYADEVKAAHGATVGQLDERALFYLRSRGIPAAAARRILVSAFCGAVLGEVAPAGLRERIDALLAARLPLEEGT